MKKLVDSKLSSTGLKKKLNSTVMQKKSWVERDHEQISVRRQCELLGLNRATLYYPSDHVSGEDYSGPHCLDQFLQ